jgi:hypothetical protein
VPHVCSIYSSAKLAASRARQFTGLFSDSDPARPADAKEMLQLWGSDQGDLRRLSSVVTRVPCHRLELGPDLNEVSSAVRGLLGEAGE